MLGRGDLVDGAVDDALMDAVIFLAAFSGVTCGLWALGAHGLAVAFGGCGLVVAFTEAWWYFAKKHDTISKEVGRIWGVSKLRFYAVLALVAGGGIGLVWHLYAMKR